MGFGWLFMLLPLVVLVLLVAAGVRLFDNRDRDARPRTPRDILDERFAKGEINREEYEERRKTLGV